MNKEIKIKLYETAVEIARKEPYVWYNADLDKFESLGFYPSTIKIIYDELVSLFSEQEVSAS